MIITKADIERAGYSKKESRVFITSAIVNSKNNGYTVKMGKNIQGCISCLAHFDLDKFIEWQKQKVENARPCNIKLAKHLLEKLVLLKKRIEELKQMDRGEG
jgi:hypothetical protein